MVAPPASDDPGATLGFTCTAGECLPGIVRSRHKKFLFVVESDVNIGSSNRQHGLVGIVLPTLGPRERPVTAEVERTGNNNVALIVLHPRGVHRLPVHGIDHDLRIKLPGWEKEAARATVCHESPLSPLTIKAMVGAVQPGNQERRHTADKEHRSARGRRRR